MFNNYSLDTNYGDNSKEKKQGHSVEATRCNYMLHIILGGGYLIKQWLVDKHQLTDAKIKDLNMDFDMSLPIVAASTDHLCFENASTGILSMFAVVQLLLSISRVHIWKGKAMRCLVKNFIIIRLNSDFSI